MENIGIDLLNALFIVAASSIASAIAGRYRKIGGDGGFASGFFFAITAIIAGYPALCFLGIMVVLATPSKVDMEIAELLEDGLFDTVEDDEEDAQDEPRNPE